MGPQVSGRSLGGFPKTSKNLQFLQVSGSLEAFQGVRRWVRKGPKARPKVGPKVGPKGSEGGSEGFEEKSNNLKNP